MDFCIDLPHFAAIFDGGEGLGVERFLVGHSSWQVNVDDRVGRPFKVLVVLLFGPGLPQTQQVGKSEAADAGKGSDRQKIAAGDLGEMGGIVLPGAGDFLGGLVHDAFVPSMGELIAAVGRPVTARWVILYNCGNQSRGFTGSGEQRVLYDPATWTAGRKSGDFAGFLMPVP